MGFDKRAIVVDGVRVNVDSSELTIDSIDQAQRTSSRMIAFWASVWGAAEAEREAADAKYRQWRAQATWELLNSDPKLSEWKVKASIEAHADFLKLKNALAKAIDHATTARGMWEACIRRSNLAQSVGANKRETMRKMGDDTTREGGDDDDSDAPTAPVKKENEPQQRERLRKVLKGKKQKETKEHG